MTLAAACTIQKTEVFSAPTFRDVTTVMHFKCLQTWALMPALMFVLSQVGIHV
jgi:hypothetical protein